MAAGHVTDKWKRSLDDYVNAAQALHLSMKSGGFNGEYPIPVDINGEILDGAHRVACAIALGIETVVVTQTHQKVWAPAWDLDWFEKNTNDDDLDLKTRSLKKLKSRLSQLME